MEGGRNGTHGVGAVVRTTLGPDANSVSWHSTPPVHRPYSGKRSASEQRSTLTGAWASGN